MGALDELIAQAQGGGATQPSQLDLLIAQASQAEPEPRGRSVPFVEPDPNMTSGLATLGDARDADLAANRGLGPTERMSEALSGLALPGAGEGASWLLRAGQQGLNAGFQGGVASYRDHGDLLQAAKDAGASALLGFGLTGIGGEGVSKLGTGLAEGEARAAALEPSRSNAMLRSFGMQGSEIDNLPQWKRDAVTKEADQIVANNGRWLPGTVKELGADAGNVVNAARSKKDELAGMLDELGARVDPREVGRLIRQGKADYSPRLPIGAEKRGAIEDIASGYAQTPQDMTRVGTVRNVTANEPPAPPPLPNDARNVDVFEGAGNVSPAERDLFMRRYAPGAAVPVEPPIAETAPGDFANAPPEARGLLERRYGSPPPPPPAEVQPSGYQAIPPPLPQPPGVLRGQVTGQQGEWQPNGVPFAEMNLERQAAGAQIPAGTPPTPANEFRRLRYGAISDAMEQGANRASPGLGTQWNQAKTQEGNARLLADASASALDRTPARSPLDWKDAAPMAAGAKLGTSVGGPIGGAIGGAAGYGVGRMLAGRGQSTIAAIQGARQSMNRAGAAIAPPIQAAGNMLQQSGAASATLTEPRTTVQDWLAAKGVSVENVPQQSRGNQLGAAAQQLLQTEPQAFGQYQQQFQQAAQQGTTALNQLIIKLEREPDFRTGPMLRLQHMTGEN